MHNFWMYLWNFLSIHVVNDGYDSDDINSSTYDCIIFEHSCYQNVEENTYDNIAVFDGMQYELRMVQCITMLSDLKYDSYIYFRHGGCHSKWWYQEKINGKGQNAPI